ncbi:immunoglobulin superfamily member 1-like [Pelobates fuscus]|uniref:immunoglobulin superfamily member 1-like n=1 Tax=Pelobates fuscus TaxID=191477 RepID=UPI002FE47C88
MNLILLSTYTIICCILSMNHLACFETLPKPTLQLYTNDTDDVIVVGDSICFVCNTTFLNSDRFILYKNRQVIAQQSEPKFDLFDLMINGSGGYTCEYCYQLTCSQSSEPEFIFVRDTFPAPEIIVKPKLIVLPGYRLTVTCMAPRTSIVFLIYHNQMLVKEDATDGNESMYVIDSASEKDMGIYICFYKTKPDHKYEIQSSRSNPMQILVKDLPRPSISFDFVQNESEKVNIYCESPYQHKGKMWFQLLNSSKDIVYETEKEKNYAEFTIYRPEHFQMKYYCVYRIRIRQDFADSVISDPLIISDLMNFTTANMIRLLLSVVILILIGIIIWNHFNDFQKTKEFPAKLPTIQDKLDRYIEEPHVVSESKTEE